MSLLNSLRLPVRNLAHSNLFQTQVTHHISRRTIHRIPANAEISKSISDATKKQGGTAKGSAAAQMQSEADKRRNEKQRELEAISGQATASQPQTADSTISPTEQSQLDREANYVEAADKVGTKMATDPASVTKEDGDLLHSRETKAFGATEKGGIASQAHSLASENTGEKKPRSEDTTLTPAEQSKFSRKANYVEAADKVGAKIATDPASVTKEDGDLLRSRETKAFGATEKGGLASQAQSLASENAGEKK